MSTSVNDRDLRETSAGSPDPAQTPNSWVGKLLSERVFNIGVATAALLIMALPVGLATVWLGFIRGESPCTLCGYERFGMVVVAVVALFILR